MTFQDFKTDFLRRVKDNKKSRWVRFGIVSLIFFLWVIWMQNAWLLLFYPLLFDIYITGYIPFTWWKKSKKPWVRTVMSWVDAIVYALVLVYFIFAFVGQNYMIPSSSLEKTLYTGDYLWVNKMTYGPRVPMTPIHFPLVHNTLPIIGTKSYLDWPANSYHRLKGFRNVELGDIVVFNFPAGDTVSVKYEESPFYYESLVRARGWKEVNSNKEEYGDIIYRPVDRRVNFVKRVVGLPGQNFRISGDTIYLDGVAQPFPEYMQFEYLLALKKPFTTEMAKEMQVSPQDYANIPYQAIDPLLAAELGINATDFIYDIILTDGMIKEFEEKGMLSACHKMTALDINRAPLGKGEMYPYGLADDWSVADWGGETGVLIPEKGLTVSLTPRNWELYKRCIRNYENHPDAYILDGQVYIDGEPASTYTFGMDYYFMMGDNRHRSQDSRFWGFVPEDHIVGTPALVLISFDKDYGGVRWNRIFSSANPDKR